MKSATSARVLLAVLVAALLLPHEAAAAPAAASQANPVPETGAVLFEDPLTAPGRLSAGRCPTGRNVGEFVGEGLILKVTGKCSEGASSAAISPPPIRGFPVSDGEVRLEVKAVSGHDRVAFVLGTLRQPEQPASYMAMVAPAAGLAAFGTGTSEPSVRTGLSGRLARDGWNSLAVRSRGQNLWLLVNDEPVLTATDSGQGARSIFIGLQRLGDPNDSQESAVVVRNLRVSALAQ